MYDKFKTLNNFQIKKYSFPTKNRPSINLCVVYCAWTSQQYIDFLYISLVSQFKYTDIDRVDIKVFVDETVLNHALKTLPDIVEIILVDNLEKFSVLNHPTLLKYNKVCVVDCDTFMFGNPFPLYETINSSCHSNEITMMKHNDSNTLEIFLERQTLCKSITDVDQYKKANAKILGVSVEEFENMLHSNHWFLSCMVCLCRSFYDNDEWKEHSRKYAQIRTFCDETVFLTYAWKNNIRVKDFSDINIMVLKGKRVDLLLEILPNISERGFVILHPLDGSYAEDMDYQSLYSLILN